MGGPPEQAGGAEPGGTALPGSQRAPGKVPHGLGRAGSPCLGWGSCPRPSMWEGEGHVSQTETALARPPAPPLPPPAVSPLPLICFHLSLPRTHLPAPFTGIPSSPHSPQSRLCSPTSSLAPKTPPGVFSIFPKWSIKPHSFPSPSIGVAHVPSWCPVDLVAVVQLTLGLSGHFCACLTTLGLVRVGVVERELPHDLHS